MAQFARKLTVSVFLLATLASCVSSPADQGSDPDDPGSEATTATSGSTALSENRFKATGIVVERSVGPPQLSVLPSTLARPPAGGEIGLGNWSWDSVGEVERAVGTTWSNDLVTVAGEWNGTTLIVESVSPGDTSLRPTLLGQRRDPACSESAFYADFTALDHGEIGLLQWDEESVGGECSIKVVVVAMDAGIQQLVDDFPAVEIAYSILQTS